MIKVKEFLDENFKHKETTSELKKDGQYKVHGTWLYSVIQTKKVDFSKPFVNGLDNCISCSCNDETLHINIIIEGRNINQYNEFKTYLNVNRDKPDEFGYYSRSTDDEIIHYIQHYVNILNSLK